MLHACTECYCQKYLGHQQDLEALNIATIIAKLYAIKICHIGKHKMKDIGSCYIGVHYCVGLNLGPASYTPGGRKYQFKTKTNPATAA